MIDPDVLLRVPVFVIEDEVIPPTVILGVPVNPVAVPVRAPVNDVADTSFKLDILRPDILKCV